MTLGKAIELIQQDLDDPGSVDIMDLDEAQRLSIEAMKRVKQERTGYETYALDLLPGETKN